MRCIIDHSLSARAYSSARTVFLFDETNLFIITQSIIFNFLSLPLPILVESESFSSISSPIKVCSF